MVDEGLVGRKLARVREHVQRVRNALPADVAAFLADRDAQDIVCFNLIQGIQGLIDLAAHVSGEAGWRIPETFRGLFELLAERHVLEPELARRLARAASMRNLLVHEYGAVDHAVVYAAASQGLQDLLAAAQQILEFLGLTEPPDQA